MGIFLLAASTADVSDAAASDSVSGSQDPSLGQPASCDGVSVPEPQPKEEKPSCTGDDCHARGTATESAAPHVRWILRAAEAGHADAQHLLGTLHEEGQAGAGANEQAALGWYCRASQQGYAPALYAVGEYVAEGRAGFSKDEAVALKWYERAAAQSYAPAERSLGVWYEQGRGGVQRDEEAARSWYRRAAARGDAAALYALGQEADRPADEQLKPRGARAEESGAGAIDWYTKAAMLGSTEAEEKLLGLLSEGEEKSRGGTQEGLASLHVAAEGGNMMAQHMLGEIYEYGRGVQKDEKVAAEWYRKAGRQGHARAQHQLGMLYERGRGVPKDDRQAAVWYQRAADQMYAPAETALGRLYEEGRGGFEPNLRLAERWYQDAWEQGHYLPALPRLVRIRIKQRNAPAVTVACVHDFECPLPF